MFLLNEAQIDTVLKDLLEVHLYDFTFYSRESFKRRINRLYKLEKYSSFQDFRVRLRSDEAYIDHFIDRITVNVTEMFRDHLNDAFAGGVANAYLPLGRGKRHDFSLMFACANPAPAASEAAMRIANHILRTA